MKSFIDPKILHYAIKNGGNYSQMIDVLSKKAGLTTDVKCLLEVVYRYHLMDETKKGYERANQLRGITDVLDVTPRDLEIQEELLDRYPNVSPRELLHVAVMLNNGIKNIICSPESAYDEVEEVEIIPMLSELSNI